MIHCQCKNTVHELGCPNRGDGTFMVPTTFTIPVTTVVAPVQPIPFPYLDPGGVFPLSNTSNIPPRPLTTADVPALVEMIARRVTELLRAPAPTIELTPTRLATGG